jgi:hypothetical protein
MSRKAIPIQGFFYSGFLEANVIEEAAAAGLVAW